MTDPTISIAEYRALLRETILHVAQFVPRSRRAEFLAGLGVELDTLFLEVSAESRPLSDAHARDGFDEGS